MGNQETGPNTGGKTKNRENGKRRKERSLSPPSRAPETEDRRQKTEREQKRNTERKAIREAYRRNKNEQGKTKTQKKREKN
jgi:hypothetical protein